MKTCTRSLLAALLLAASLAQAQTFEQASAAYQRKDYAAAFSAFSKLADLGDPRAQTLVAIMYQNGDGVTRDQQQAITWYRKAAEQGYAGAQHNLALAYRLGQGVPRDLAQAMLWLRKAADQGHAMSQVSLGEMYGFAIGVPKDEREAANWYRKAADQGNLTAQTYLGAAYLNGAGVPRDEAQGVALLQKAAERGSPRAQDQLGSAYADGKGGLPKDDQQATNWWRKAADLGYSTAQYKLATAYRDGKGVPKDPLQAAYWYKKAAELGNAAAQFMLGMMYETGQGVPVDQPQALQWYRKAADGGFSEGHYFLGRAYADGRGVQRDVQQAQQWYRKAVELGHPTAAAALRELEQRGGGSAAPAAPAIASPAPPPQPPAAPAPATAGSDANALRDALRQWLVQNHNGNDVFKTNLPNAMVDNFNKFDTVRLIFGAKDMRSGKCTQLYIFGGELFAFPLNELQATFGNCPSANTTTQPFGNRSGPMREDPPAARLSMLAFDSNTVDPNQRVTGRVSVLGLRLPAADLALRLSYISSAGMVAYFTPVQLNAGQNEVRFSFPEANAGKSAKDSLDSFRIGPLPVFLDLVVMPKQGAALSPRLANSLGTLLEWGMSTRPAFAQQPAPLTLPVLPSAPNTASGAGQCPLSNARFQVKDNVIRDTATNLSWTRCPLITSADDRSVFENSCKGATTVTDEFSLAKGVVSAFARRNRGNWRLPTAKELEAAFPPSCSKRDIQASPFKEYTGGFSVWTSTTEGRRVYAFDVDARKAELIDATGSPAVIVLVSD